MVSSAIGVNDRPSVAVSHRLDGRIQHGVHELGIGTRADRPTDNKSIEAVDHRGQIHLTSRELELCDVGEPLLIRRCRMEVAVDEMSGAGLTSPR